MGKTEKIKCIMSILTVKTESHGGSYNRVYFRRNFLNNNTLLKNQ